MKRNKKKVYYVGRYYGSSHGQTERMLLTDEQAERYKNDLNYFITDNALAAMYWEND